MLHIQTEDLSFQHYPRVHLHLCTARSPFLTKRDGDKEEMAEERNLFIFPTRAAGRGRGPRARIQRSGLGRCHSLWWVRVLLASSFLLSPSAFSSLKHAHSTRAVFPVFISEA